ncbi:MAG TPA: universal stress protein [Hyphomicrobiales bacterium]|nr:universal stress protein [Hyphomicrobiales bacterium]
MSYATVMVHVDVSAPADARLKIAAEQARRFGARLVGIAAAEPILRVYVGAPVPAALRLADEEEAEELLAEAEARFRAAVKDSGCALEWRQAIGDPTTFVARESRAADLLVLGAPRRNDDVDEPAFGADELTLRAGRPILVVPPEIDRFEGRRVLVGWKDTPEARRAVADAVPLLAKAEEVIIAAIDEWQEPERTRESASQVVVWLGRRGVDSRAVVLPAYGPPASQLDTYAWENGADLIVAGAYGHSRLREWALGGVTHDLLHTTRRCSFLSH